MGVPAATEFLDTTFGQFYTEPSAGARSAPAPRRARSTASWRAGYRCRSASRTAPTATSRWPSTRCHGRAAHATFFRIAPRRAHLRSCETTGNPYVHAVLRGAAVTREPTLRLSRRTPVSATSPATTTQTSIMVDCSHGNSDKDANRQIDVANAIMKNLRGSPVRALMIESHLVAGRQNAPVRPTVKVSPMHASGSRTRKPYSTVSPTPFRAREVRSTSGADSCGANAACPRNPGQLNPSPSTPEISPRLRIMATRMWPMTRFRCLLDRLFPGGSDEENHPVADLAAADRRVVFIPANRHWPSIKSTLPCHPNRFSSSAFRSPMV